MWNRESQQKSPGTTIPTPIAPVNVVEPKPAPLPEVAAAPAPAAAPTKAKGSTLVIKGELTSAEDLVFEGLIEGKISLPDHVLTIGLGAQVSAELVARVVVVHGTVTGNVSASERVEIRSSGRISGDVVVPRIMMNDGATFSGRLETRVPGKPDVRERQKQELIAV
jgi:cytoskeletal protein CcmA (bactofilin family)